MRMDVYFLGLLFGIFLRKCKDGKITWAYNMKWYYQVLGWAMAVFFLVGSLFGPHVYYNHDDPHYYSQESSISQFPNCFFMLVTF